MLRLLRNKKAQNTMEYALLISIVIGVFAAMQIYIKRGLQARVKYGTDNLPEKVMLGSEDSRTVSGIFGTDTQYEPYYVRENDYNMTTTSKEGTEKSTITEKGGVRELTGASSSRSGTQTIGGAKDDVKQQK